MEISNGKLFTTKQSRRCFLCFYSFILLFSNHFKVRRIITVNHAKRRFLIQTYLLTKNNNQANYLPQSVGTSESRRVRSSSGERTDAIWSLGLGAVPLQVLLQVAVRQVLGNYARGRGQLVAMVTGSASQHNAEQADDVGVVQAAQCRHLAIKLEPNNSPSAIVIIM